MASPPPPPSPAHEAESELASQINLTLLEQTGKIIEAVKQTHVPYETLQITELKLAESEAKTDFWRETHDSFLRQLADVDGPGGPYARCWPPLPSKNPKYYKRISAERAEILELPDTAPASYTLPSSELYVSTPSLKALCSKNACLHDDLLDLFCHALATGIRVKKRILGYIVTIGSSLASELCDIGVRDKAAMIKLARSGFSWESTSILFFPLRPPGQDQWLLVWVDLGSNLK